MRRLTPREGEAIQGFPVNWTLPKDAIEDSEDLDALRYHAVGNAVTVNVAEWLAQRIADALAQSSAEPAAARLPDSDGVLQGTAR